MARKVRDRELDSRDARARLQSRAKPYYRAIERGLHVGYRRLKGKPGTWWARHYLGNGGYATEWLGAADDFSDPDGIAVLDFWQAQTKARDRMVLQAQTAAGVKTPPTVEEAVLDYLDFLDVSRRSGLDARYRASAFILPQLGRLSCSSLTADTLRKWLVALVREPPRKRTKRGARQQYKFTVAGPEYLRRRRASANRVLTILKAALNRAWREGHIASDAAWRRVEPFENVDAARVRYLSVPECQRLIQASDPEFQPLVEAALQTGARYGELARLEVQDFDQRAGTLLIRQSKAGKSRHIVLTEEGISLFVRLCQGRPANRMADARLVVGVVRPPVGAELAEEVGALIGHLGGAEPIDGVRRRCKLTLPRRGQLQKHADTL
jgi:integrase